MSARTLIIGAGPAGLATATALACDGHGGDVEVVDPSGDWLGAWRSRFARQAIAHLRSPAVHHPHPEPFALLAFAQARTPEPDDPQLVRSGGTNLPTTPTFDAFVDHLVAALGSTRQVSATSAVALGMGRRGRPRVLLADGSRREPERVVVATDRRHPRIPRGLSRAVRAGTARTGDSADVADTPRGGHVTVIGGGLSAAHLALGAVERGARVALVARRRLTVRRFDTHPSWLGPKKLRSFEHDPDPGRRRRTIDAARGGGSIPHRHRRLLDHAVAEGRLTLHERCTPVDSLPIAGRTRVRLDDGTCLDTDRLWLATAGVVRVTRDPLLQPALAASSVAVVGGLPDLPPDLALPGTGIHLAGSSTALVLGPTAGNLAGHRRAALRIAAAVGGRDPVAADRISSGDRACRFTPPG